jgi:hypothetical protein
MQPDRSGRAMESDTVWIHVDTNHRIDHPNHLKVFADQDAAHAWFAEHDREGVAFESCDWDAQSNTAAIRARAAGIIATTDRARAALFRAATAGDDNLRDVGPFAAGYGIARRHALDAEP